MPQPTWKFIANLGDASPIEYGGLFVYVDETGVYAPEVELLISPEDEENGKWEVRRFILEPCSFIDGVLSDNRFHPDYEAWFAQDLKSMADCYGMDVDEVVGMFTSDNLLERARAWEMVGEYHGWDNLNSYPLYFTREEIEARYDVELERQH